VVKHNLKKCFPKKSIQPAERTLLLYIHTSPPKALKEKKKSVPSKIVPHFKNLQKNSTEKQ
jgi:hypothetical protein